MILSGQSEAAQFCERNDLTPDDPGLLALGGKGKAAKPRLLQVAVEEPKS